MNSVRCKFLCVGVNTDGEQSMIGLRAVTTDCDENDLFFKYTPWGNLEFGWIDSVVASKMFIVGKEYYIDIQKAE